MTPRHHGHEGKHKTEFFIPIFRYSYMAKKRDIENESKKIKEVKKQQKAEEPVEERDEFDFGGLPKNVPFKRNMGCGG